VTKRLTATASAREITHLRAYVVPSDLACPAPCPRDAYSDVVAVGSPYPDGSIALDVGLWLRNADAGTVDYDVTIKFAGAGQTDGPCSSRCHYLVEAWYRVGSVNNMVKRLLYYDCLYGCWTLTRRLTATGASLSKITHLRAYVFPSSCPAPCSRQTYDTGFVVVSDHVYKNYDILQFASVEAPILTENGTMFCTRFLLKAGTHYARSTLTDQYIACEAAVAAAGYTITSVLTKIIDAGGGSSLEVLVGDDLRPFPLPDPTTPPVRLDWEEETGCEQEIPEWSVEAASGHVERDHGYVRAPDPSQDSYWDLNVPWEKLVFPYAMRFPAYPGKNAGSCERVIEYDDIVGFERVFSATEPPYFRLTTTYTVVTDESSGALITAHPGVPGEIQ
jgi:hypothetical protein